MKRLAFVFAALLGLCSQAHATWTAYYSANSYLPGYNYDSLYLSGPATFYNISNPTTPTPPGDTTNWFANPTISGGYATVPTSVLGATSGVIAWQYYYSLASASNTYDIVRVTGTFSSQELLIRFDAPNQRFSVFENSNKIFDSGAGSVTMQTNQQVVFTYTATGMSIQIASNSPVTSTTGFTPTNVNGIYVLSGRGAVDGDTNEYLGDLGFSNNSNDTYPPTPPTPTLTYTDTATFTASPTATPTVTATSSASPTNSPNYTATATPTNTPNWTATATPTASPTSTATASPTSSFTASPTITRTSTRTPSNSPSPTASPTQTSSASPTASPTPTNSPSPTASPTAYPTPVPGTQFLSAASMVSDFAMQNRTHTALVANPTPQTWVMPGLTSPCIVDVIVPYNTPYVWTIWWQQPGATAPGTTYPLGACVDCGYVLRHAVRPGDSLIYQAIGAPLTPSTTPGTAREEYYR